MRALLPATWLAGVWLAVACSGAAEHADVDVRVSVAPQPPTMGAAAVEVTLNDTAGETAAPLTGATVRIEGNMSHAGMVPVFADAAEVRPGVYTAELELTMAGDWFLIVTAELADGREVERTHDLPGVRRDT